MMYFVLSIIYVISAIYYFIYMWHLYPYLYKDLEGAGDSTTAF